jgi:7,8-dihydroneopterin aldolase/epimerase/oxygenase
MRIEQPHFKPTLNNLLTIELTNLQFFAHHGVYEEERMLGNSFTINLFVSFVPAAAVVTALEETINYVSLFEITRKHMLQATPLLETVAMLIAVDIKGTFPQVKKIAIALTKQNPPIVQFIGQTGVRYEVSY